MKDKDFSKLSLQLIVTDLHDASADPSILAGVAIPAERAKEFFDAVEQLAVEQFDGATFEDLLEYDVHDLSCAAALRLRADNETGEGDSDVASAEQAPTESAQVSSGLTAEQRKAIRKAAEEDRRNCDRRKKMESSIHRKEMSQKRKKLGLKVIKGGANGEEEGASAATAAAPATTDLEPQE